MVANLTQKKSPSELHGSVAPAEEVRLNGVEDSHRSSE